MSPYIQSLRIRTLFLSASGIILGSGIAASLGVFRLSVFIFTFLTAVSLQILSNLSNELGDYERGVDNSDRNGPVFSMQKGTMTVQDMYLMILIMIWCSAIFGLIAIYLAFTTFFSWKSLIMILFGIFSMVAAVFYTLGKHPYGYRGWGDIFVFIFFGIASVIGSFYLVTSTFEVNLLLPASSIGLFSVAVLNLNNMRDIDNDKTCNKKTLAVRIGLRNAKIYHCIVITAAFFMMAFYTNLTKNTTIAYLYLLVIPLFIFHLWKVIRGKGAILDKQFPILVIGTFIFSLLAVAGLLIPME